MSELTPEEKKKIYEEEKERMLAKEKIKEEKSKKEKQKTIISLVVMVIFIIIVIQICGVFDSGDKKSSTSETTEITLNTDIRFTGTQFIIKNNDTFDWTNVKFELNSGILRGGYNLKAQLITAGQVYTVGAMQFTKGDGTRFNPLTQKPKEMFISCDTPKGRGYYSGGWE